MPGSFLHQIRTLQVPWHLSSQAPLTHAKVLSTLPSLQIVTYYGLSYQMDMFLDNLPQHSLKFETTTLRSIIDLVNPSGDFTGLRSELKSHFRKIWERDGPVPFARMATVSVCEMGDLCGHMWVRTASIADRHRSALTSQGDHRGHECGRRGRSHH